MLTPDQITKIRTAAGVSPAPTSAPTQSLSDRLGIGKATIPQPQSAQTGSLLGPTIDGLKGLGTLYGGGDQGIAHKLSDDVSSGAADIQKGLNDPTLAGAGNVIKGTVKAGARTAGDVAGSVYAPIGAAIGSTGVGKVFDAIGKAANTNAFSPLTYLNDMPWYQKLVMEHPNAGEDITRAMNIGMGSMDAGKIEPSTAMERTVKQVKNIPTDVTNAVQGATQGASDLYKSITSKSPEQIDAMLNKYFTKGVKPSVAGKTKTSGQMDAYNDKAIGAVKTIVENKPNLDIKDEYGESTGELPKNLNQFTQAIDQTKQNIFSQYDALAKNAGEAGAKVELTPIADELTTITNNPVMNDLHPDVVRYAQVRGDALRARGAYDTETAQAAIKSLNNSLDAFYKNPSYDTASKATVDSMIVNKLRSGLDSAIEGKGGDGYQELKNKYGQLKTIESDVVKRALVDARKNGRGLIDFTDIVSGADAVKGLLTMSPVEMARAGAMKGISAYYKYLNDPNTAIKKLFQTAEKNGAPPGSFNSGETPLQLQHPEIGKLEQEEGKPSTKGKSGFGLAKIQSDHPEVIPYIDEAMKNAKIVEKLPKRTILEGKIKDGRTVRLIVDHQLGTREGIAKKTFLNNAYFKQ